MIQSHYYRIEILNNQKRVMDFMGLYRFMHPKERFPSLYAIIEKAAKKANLDEARVGELFVTFVASYPKSRCLSNVIEARDLTQRRIKKEFQQKTREFFSTVNKDHQLEPILASYNLNESGEKIGMVGKILSGYKGNFETIEGQIERLIRHYPNDYLKLVGAAVLNGSRIYHQKTPDTPLGFNKSIFIEYNRILFELQSIGKDKK